VVTGALHGGGSGGPALGLEGCGCWAAWDVWGSRSTGFGGGVLDGRGDRLAAVIWRFLLWGVGPFGCTVIQRSVGLVRRRVRSVGSGYTGRCL